MEAGVRLGKVDVERTWWHPPPGLRQLQAASRSVDPA
jgi:hypothetical protein